MSAVTKLSLEDYLALEPHAELKSEFANGEIIAMAGAQPAHNLVKDAISRRLQEALEGRRCMTMSSDQRVHVAETRFYAYPDVVVVCGEPKFVPPNPLSLTNAQVIFEVLSPDTARWDREGKFAHYRRMASLSTYILVDPEAQTMEQYVREPDESWRVTFVERGGRLKIPALDVVLEAEQVFAPLDLLPPP